MAPTAVPEMARQSRESSHKSCEDPLSLALSLVSLFSFFHYNFWKERPCLHFLGVSLERRCVPKELGQIQHGHS